MRRHDYSRLQFSLSISNCKYSDVSNHTGCNFYNLANLKTTGCGRKNSPIWEGHSFGLGARTVVGSASSNSGVRAVFSVHHGVIGRTSSLYC